MKSESKLENRENLNNHVAEDGDSDFEVPEEDVCECFAKKIGRIMLFTTYHVV